MTQDLFAKAAHDYAIEHEDDFDNGYDSLFDAFYMGVQHALGHQWHSAAEPPEDGIRGILVHDRRKPYTIINPSGKGWAEEFEKRDDVTRWMPIPKFNPEKQ